MRLACASHAAWSGPAVSGHGQSDGRDFLVATYNGLARLLSPPKPGGPGTTARSHARERSPPPHAAVSGGRLGA